MYARRRGTRAADVWHVPADGSGKPALLIPDAESPGRCEFVLASADDLSAFGDATVDVVTTRSVLIYLDRKRKRRAFQEFHRVLRPGGRVSIFEPINKFGYPEPEGWFCGYDLTAIPELVSKVLAAASPDEERTLIDFDERELLTWADEAGFEPIRLEYAVDNQPGLSLQK